MENSTVGKYKMKDLNKQREKLFRTNCGSRQKQYGNYVCVSGAKTTKGDSFIKFISALKDFPI